MSFYELDDKLVQQFIAHQDQASWGSGTADAMAVALVNGPMSAPVVIDAAVEAAARKQIIGSWEQKTERERDVHLRRARHALEAAAPLLGPQPLLDREALEDVLTRHWFEYIGQEEGFDCGCNEQGTLSPMPTVTECVKHLADMVMELARPMPTLGELKDSIRTSLGDGCACESHICEAASRVLDRLNGGES